MNEIHISGVARATWSYDGNLYVKLSVNRDPPRPARSGENGGNGDYIAVVFPGGANQGMRIERGQTLTVHGWLQSRDISEDLETFLRRAQRRRGTEAPPPIEQAADTRVLHTVTEIVAERWGVS